MDSIEVNKKICSAAMLMLNINRRPDWPGLFISNKDYLYIQSILKGIQTSPKNKYAISTIEGYFSDTIQKDEDQWLETENPQEVETVNTNLEHRVETGIIRLTFKGSHNTGFFIRGDDYLHLRLTLNLLKPEEEQAIDKILKIINHKVIV